MRKPKYSQVVQPYSTTYQSSKAVQKTHEADRKSPQKTAVRQKKQPCCSSCSCLILLISALCLLATGFYFLFPNRTNLLILGLDYAEWDSPVARSDTIIAATIIPLTPYVGLLSIPRDLWVVIPNVGENRINTAHFFAESQTPGSGPQATINTIKFNMGISIPYYLRIKFYGFTEVVNALGGIEIDLPEAMAGYPAGKHYLTGKKALAFVRSREYADDFRRMEQAQILLKALFKNMLYPGNWTRLPDVFSAAWRAIDTNIPFWLLPRLGLAFLRAGPNGIDNRVIGREMVTPFTTNQGAAVLLPNWEMINPMIQEMFH